MCELGHIGIVGGKRWVWGPQGLGLGWTRCAVLAVIWFRSESVRCCAREIFEESGPSWLVELGVLSPAGPRSLHGAPFLACCLLPAWLWCRDNKVVTAPGVGYSRERSECVVEILTKWFSSTRLETRTKEFSSYASIRV